MTIALTCPHCQKSLRVPDEFAGRRARCPGCSQAITIPATSTDAAAATASTAVAASIAPAPVAASPQTSTSAATSTALVANVPAAAAPAEEPEVMPWMGKGLRAEDEMDMTPMIDMTFLLLIFFITTASFALQKSIEMPAPDSEEGATQSRTIEELEQDDDFVIVRIDKDDTVWVDDSEAPSRHELLAKLRDARNSGSGRGPSSLLVMASGDCHHETVVMVLDSGTAVGMENVRLANLGEDDF